MNKSLLKGNEIYRYYVLYGLESLNAEYLIERVVPSGDRNIITPMFFQGKIKRLEKGKALFRQYSTYKLKGRSYWVNINNLRAAKRRIPRKMNKSNRLEGQRRNKMSILARREILSTIIHADDEKLTAREMLEYWQNGWRPGDEINLMDAIADLRELARILGIERKED